MAEAEMSVVRLLIKERTLDGGRLRSRKVASVLDMMGCVGISTLAGRLYFCVGAIVMVVDIVYCGAYDELITLRNGKNLNQLYWNWIAEGRNGKQE